MKDDSSILQQFLLNSYSISMTVDCQLHQPCACRDLSSGSRPKQYSLDKSAYDDLATIDMDMWETVCDNTSTPVNCPSSLKIVKTPETADSTNSSFSDDLIKTIVTPRKIEKVREALEKEKEPHRCALKLLRYIFTAAEIRESNTDGTHGKACLDATKLNSLKGWF